MRATYLLEHYRAFKVEEIKGRYLSYPNLVTYLKNLPAYMRLTTEGTSVWGENIYSIEFGNGPKKILMWSQMHGNESTTTKAVLDLLEFIVTDQNDDFKKIYPLLIEHLTQEEGEIKLDKLGGLLDAAQMEKISSIAFEPEKHELHAWDRHEIYVKTLKDNAGLETVQTLLNLRHFLIQRKMAEFGEQLKTGELPENAQEFMEDFKDYKTLEVLIAKKRNLVIMPFMR